MAEPSLILFEDDHLLVINKPPGINTHAAATDASAGIYDWLRHREPRWATLATHQRLDKETSGVLVFGKTREANQSLAGQFAGRDVAKSYLLVTDRDPGPLPRRIDSAIFKAGGNDFRTTNDEHNGQPAETIFKLVERQGAHWLIEATPLTGRTHQIRLHARDAGFPILGDTKYGGSPFARLCLHARTLEITHPVTAQPLRFDATVDFDADPRLALRTALWPIPEGRHSGRPGDLEAAPVGNRNLAPPTTNAWRLIHGASDGNPGWYVDHLGDWLLAQSEQPLTEPRRAQLAAWVRTLGLKGAYEKLLDRHVRKADAAESSPRPVLGETAPDRFPIVENGVRYWLSFNEGYSTGLFLDQKDNRRRLLTGHLARGMSFGRPGGSTPLAGLTCLNTFAYTCGFSVCAARAGATVTSLDLSRKYLDWGRDNFRLNGLDPDAHDFIYGDCFDWMKRLTKKGRQFDVVLLDPPTFSQSKQSGVFRVEKDYGRLVGLALGLLAPDGLLFCSSNCATWPLDGFLATVREAVTGGGRRITAEFIAPQPPDFPTSRDEHGYLKTVWLRIGG